MMNKNKKGRLERPLENDTKTNLQNDYIRTLKEDSVHYEQFINLCVSHGLLTGKEKTKLLASYNEELAKCSSVIFAKNDPFYNENWKGGDFSGV